MVSDEQLATRLQALLADSDLETTTEKMLRKKLEEEFGVPLADKKAFIREQVEAYLAAQCAADQGDEEEADEDEEGEEEEEQASGRKRGGGGLNATCQLSEPMQKFLGVETMSRPQVVKRLWEYIRANNLQDPKNKRNIVIDDTLRTLFKPPLNMFNMNSQLSSHVYTSDGGGNTPRQPKAKTVGEKRSGSGGSSKAPKAKQRKGEDGAKREATGGFAMTLKLSEPLAEFLGKDSATRSELTKSFWEYFKSNNLQDPSDKRFICCDAKLRKLFGVERFQGFGLQKLLKDLVAKD